MNYKECGNGCGLLSWKYWEEQGKTLVMVIGIPVGIRNVNRQHTSQALTSTVNICCPVK
jgi:hypothetical protein